MKNLETIPGSVAGSVGGPGAGPVAARPKLETLLRWAAFGAVTLALAMVVLFVTGDSAFALQGNAVNGGSADLQSGVTEGQALTVGLIGLGAGIAALIFLLKKNYAGTVIVVIAAAFAIVFASDPTGTVSTAVAAAVELLTGQG